MSDNENINNTPLDNKGEYKGALRDARSLMARRMGIMYGDQSVNIAVVDADSINTDDQNRTPLLDGLNSQKAKLDYNGGHLQQQRMILDKRRSLDRAVLYSYQGADVKKVDADEDELPVRALINPNKLKMDYDEKVLSIGFEHGYQPGDVFEWVDTGTKWLIYLQQLTELAYFRGDIKKCVYTLTFLNAENNPVTVYAAVRGPVETKINTIQYNGISHDIPNNSLSLMVPKTPDTLWFFNRNNNNGIDSHTTNFHTRERIFYLKSLEDIELPLTAWGTETANWISTPGIIEVVALENYADPQRDDLENLIAGGLESVPKVEDYNDEEVEATIEGDTFIKPKISKRYTYSGEGNGEFLIDPSIKVPVKIVEKTNSYAVVKWDNVYSGQFKLIYREKVKDELGITRTKDTVKTIVVESLY